MRRRPDEGAENALSLEHRLTAIGGKRTLTWDKTGKTPKAGQSAAGASTS